MLVQTGIQLSKDRKGVRECELDWTSRTGAVPFATGNGDPSLYCNGVRLNCSREFELRSYSNTHASFPFIDRDSHITIMVSLLNFMP